MHEVNKLNQLIYKYAASTWYSYPFSALKEVGRRIGDSVGTTFGRLGVQPSRSKVLVDTITKDLTTEEANAYLERETDKINRRIRLMRNELARAKERASKAVRSPFI